MPGRPPASQANHVSGHQTALLGLTRYLATYWNEASIRVKPCLPEGHNGQSDEFVARLSQLIPLGRMARAESIGPQSSFRARTRRVT